MDLDYRRTYWLLFLGVGLLFLARTGLARSTGEPLDPTGIVPGLAALAIVVASLFGLRDPERAGGPDGPTLLFFVAVAAFVLLLVSILLQVVTL